MARKIKIPNHILKRRERQEENRKENTRSERKYYLIVCEGEKTEPNYFEALKNDLPPGVLNIFEIKIEGTGHNTQSLMSEAIRLCNSWKHHVNRKIDKLWVVFDKDSFPAQAFNATIQSCSNTSNPVIECAWSNEAFELWYLLHFNYYNTAISRTRYQSMIEQNLKQYLGDEYRYEKNCKEMYAWLKKYGDKNKAIIYAKRLADNCEGQTNYADHNPCTMVYKLVEELFEYERNI